MTATPPSYNITYTDVEEFTGVAYTDLMISGAPMSSPEWQAYVTEYVEVIAQVVHRYCNVPTFDPAQPEAAIVELHSGRGPTDDSVWPAQYLPSDGQFYLRDLYYGTPAITVEEDTNAKTDVPGWTTRTVRSALAGGDYEVITKKELTMISFHNNIPNQGINNVRFTYVTGYAATSKPYADIKFQILRVFKNLILSKKGIESIFTMFAQGTRDMSSLPNQYSEAQILSNMEKSLLDRYKRYMVPGGPFTD